MKKRGPRRRNIINTSWNGNFAYSVGLFATDGNLSPDRRHLHLTSKDEEIVLSLKKILSLKNTIGKKARGGSKDKRYFVLQFGSVQFYGFLLDIGLMPAKSKKLKRIKVPDEYFWDFLRGCLDGDGNVNEFKHPESSRAQLRLRFSSASRPFLNWLLRTVRRIGKIQGGWIEIVPRKSVLSLNFGKRDAITILQKMYRRKDAVFLKRKYTVVRKYLGE